MKTVQKWLFKLNHRVSHALSLSFSAGKWRWVYGQIERDKRLSFKVIRASGGGQLDIKSDGDDFFESSAVEKVIKGALKGVSPALGKPEFIVISIPSKHAYLGELVVNNNESEQLIRYQIQEMMELAAGQSDREAAFDWQVNTELSDGRVSLAVTGIDQKQVDEILAACQICGLTCLGITLDSVAAMNGYLQMAPASIKSADIRFLLHGELSRQRVRLAVFSQGVLFNESWEHSEEGFSVVRAISSLERLVSAWTRDSVPEEMTSVRLILGGELMYAKGCDSTAKRSQILSPHLIDIAPHKALQQSWHDDVVPFGALEAMPCE